MPSDQTYDRILITRMRFIGDIVLTTPVIRSVRDAFPNAYIAYMGDKDAVQLLEYNPCLNEIIPFDYNRPVLREQSRVVLELRRRAFDLVLDLFGNPRSALMTYLSGARTRVGPDRRGRGQLYTVRVRDDGVPKPATEFHLQTITALGIPVTSRATEIFFHEDERLEMRRFLQNEMFDGLEIGPATRLICLHPGATWPAKKWLPERFARLAVRLGTELGALVVVTGAPQEQAVVKQVCRAAPVTTRPSGLLSLRRLAALLAECSVVVSNDAGPMHIAAAVRTPTIGLFGPGEENIWFPYAARDGHMAIRKDVVCHPCHLNVCNRSGDGYMECMKRLEVDEVFNAVALALRFPREEDSR